MGWVRISDDIYDNPKFDLVGPLGIALHLTATAHCNRNLTDGYIIKSKARRLLDFDGIGITTAGNDLCAVGVDGDDAALLVLGWMVAADLLHESGHNCHDCHQRDDGGEPHDSEYLIHDYLKYQPSREEVEKKVEANRERVRKWNESRKGSKANAVTNALANALTTPTLMEQLHDTPNPNPNPSSFTSNEVKEGGGCAGREPHQASPKEPPPPCKKHPEGNADTPCAPCGRRRQWEQAQAEEAKRDELEHKRATKAALAKALKDCRLCDEDGWVLGQDGTPIEPAVKCQTHTTNIAGAS